MQHTPYLSWRFKIIRYGFNKLPLLNGRIKSLIKLFVRLVLYSKHPFRAG